MKFDNKPNRILIIRTDRMGDVLLSTPVFSALKQKYPNAFISVLIKPYTQDIVAGHPDVNEIIVLETPKHRFDFKTFLKNVRLLKHKNFDTALILYPTFYISLLCRLASIPKRIGTAYRLYSFLFNQKIYEHRKKSGRHEVDLNLDFAQALGANVEPVLFKIHIPDKNEQTVKQLLQQKQIKQPFVVIHPGSGGSAMDWPLKNFGQLAKQISANLKLDVVITGTKSEKQLVDTVIAASDNSATRLDGKMDIKELAALLKTASLVIANSTGPLHLAVAVNTPVIGLYCPLQPCLPERWGPYHQFNSVIMPPNIDVCHKCDQNSCKHGNCMELIDVNQVYNLVVSKIESST